jgi:glycosyltransferase involved in cell wall biosynthesis
VAKGRNIGIEQSRGEFIAILDADDVSFPQRLGKQVASLRADPAVVGVGSGVVWFDESTKRSETFLYPERHRNIELLLRTGFNPIPHSTLLFRRSALEASAGYSEVFEKCEDFEFILRLARVGRLASVPEALVQITYHRDSHTYLHRPKGRDTRYYTTLAMIIHALRSGAGAMSPSVCRVESWLDEVGACGIAALQGRWALRVILQDLLKLDAWSLRYVLSAFICNVWQIWRCCGKQWWKYSDTPARVAETLQATDC